MFLETLASGSILLASAGAAPSWCNPPAAPVVRVGLIAPQPTADLSLSMERLKTFKIDSKNPYGAHVKTHVGGVTDGVIHVQQKMSLGGMRVGASSCLWVASVDVTIQLVQKVYVASEYKPGTCMYNGVWEHEHQHVRVDREIINKYRPVYQQAVSDYLARGAQTNPFSNDQKEIVQQRILENLRQVVSIVTDRMEVERAAVQQNVDTRAEYDRISTQCQGKR